MASNNLTQGMECYLSPKAKAVIDNLTELGLDRDLAFECANQALAEEDMFELPNPMEKSDKWTESKK